MIAFLSAARWWLHVLAHWFGINAIEPHRRGFVCRYCRVFTPWEDVHGD